MIQLPQIDPLEQKQASRHSITACIEMLKREQDQQQQQLQLDRLGHSRLVAAALDRLPSGERSSRA